MNTIEDVKARLDIVEVIGQYVQLQKAGRNLKAPCPFHTERTPSFIVSPERQSWHCFGACGSGGDVFSFVMRKEGLDFGQALRLLAEKAGVALPERRQEAEDGRWERLHQANEAAGQYFHHLLLNSEAGKAARQYLERRGIDDGTAQEFLLGYAPPGWEVLRNHQQERGFLEEELLAAGLLVEGESGPHDRFRHRLMFPIRDVKGRIIGFGGRSLDDSLPKYLNTPQTAAFDKGSTLYALERARDAIRRERRAVIVEGYMDAIAAHQHGFTNVVASMGTALTERQVRLLKRYTRNLVLALDADAAGSEAALRGHEVATEAARQAEEPEVVPVLTWRGLVRYQEAVSLDLRVAELPPERDPDDVIRSDPEAWRELIVAAKPVLDYKFEAIAARTDRGDPRARSQAVQ
ncbi:MAG: DNA primase, partial [Dehalococcoidia bacterium]